uniref:Plastid-encoded RNA polymerase subunit alpha n=1 Tax=Chlorodesmis fastigiata TaxID=189431 RepID=A0A2P0QHB9_CHLFS|nr:RNA polymerase a-subunit [Chlorodesmis fastigiata]ARO74171.1 RNA polymerase a-subunit [Chlorodesmis fastigiata]
MNIKNFSCISSRVEDTGQLYGCFKIGPFPESQSLTFANSLRRTLLAHQSKCIFNAVKIYGVEHEFSSLLGVRESVVDILLNLEKLVFQTTKPLTKPQIAFVNFFGPGILQGKHLHLPSNFKCINPSQYIATLEVDGQLMFKLFFPSMCEVVSQKRFLKKSFTRKQWSNLTSTNYCLNIFSRKFFKLQKKLIFNKFQNEDFQFSPKENQKNRKNRKNQENFLFLKSSLNIIEKVNYTIQPFEINYDNFFLIRKIKQSENENINRNVKPIKLSSNLKLVRKKKIKKIKRSASKLTNTIPPTLTKYEFIIFEIWTNGSIHPQTAILKGINELLLTFFPYSLRIFKKNTNFSRFKKLKGKNFSRFKKTKRKYITKLSKKSFRRNFLNLDISNFHFDLETLIFLKNNQIHRIVDFLIYLPKINWNSHFYDINQLNKDSKIQTTLLNFKQFIYRLLKKKNI